MKKAIRITRIAIPVWLIITLLLSGICMIILEGYLLGTHPSVQIIAVVDSLGDFTPRIWIYDGDRNQGYGNYTFENGVYHGLVEDYQGNWSLNKLQCGILPHDWDKFGKLHNEISVSKNMANNELILEMSIKRGEFSFYNPKGQVNFGVAFWFALDEETYELGTEQSKQLVVDLQYVCNASSGENPYQIVAFQSSFVDRDYHVLIPCIRLTQDTWHNLRIDVGKELGKAFDELSTKLNIDINQAQLKCVETYTEANKGYGEYSVGRIRLDYQQSTINLLAISLIAVTISIVAASSYLLIRRLSRTNIQEQKN